MMYNYNTTRKPLILKAYGRNVQQLVESMCALEGKVERTQRARGIIQLMETLDANNKHSADNAQKRWDDLFIMADYTLEVDSPYPVPEKVVFKPKSQHVYTQRSVKLRSYGRNIECLIQKAVETANPATQEQMVVGIVKLMKSLGTVWNSDTTNCDTLLTYIAQMGKGKFTVDFEKLKVRDICASMRTEKHRGNKAHRGVGRRKKLASMA